MLKGDAHVVAVDSRPALDSRAGPRSSQAYQLALDPLVRVLHI